MASLVTTRHAKGAGHRVRPPLVYGVGAAILLAGIAAALGDTASILCGIAFFIAGLAHGAADEDSRSLQPLGAAQVAAYLMVAVGLMAALTLAPATALFAFLVLSAWHFYAEDADSPVATRAAVALLAIGGSALFRPGSTMAVFALISDDAFPPLMFGALQAIGATGVTLAILALARDGFPAWKAALALLAVALLNPVLAVGLVFFATHALPASLRQIARFGSRSVIRAVAAPVAIATLGTVLLTIGVLGGWVAVSVAASLAIAMATPHMLTTGLGSDGAEG